MAVRSVSMKNEGKILFGQTIREHRKRMHLTQPELAGMLDVNPNTIKNWERDLTKPDHDLVPVLCNLLGIKLHELYRMDPEKDLSSLESRVVDNLRLLDPVDRKVIDKMISVMVNERLLHGRQ